MKDSTSLKVCQECGALCCKTVGGPNVTKKQMQKILKAGHPNFFVKHSNNHYEIKSKNGTCMYLNKNNLCSIHKVRPPICRWWPVNYSYEKGKLKLFLVECPLTKYTSKKYIERMKKQIKKFPKKAIEEFYKDTYLSEREIKLVKKGQSRFKQNPLK